MKQTLATLVPSLLAVVIGFGVGALVLAAAGYDAAGTFSRIFTEGFRDSYGFGQVLRTSSILCFTGLSVAVAFHAGLFNIGAEGQLLIGGAAAGIAGFYIKHLSDETLQSVPFWVWWLAVGGAAMAGGAFWGGIAGFLKAFSGAHEVISTIMLNFIAFALVNWLVRPEEGSYAMPGRMQTPRIPAEVRVPKLAEVFPGFEGSTFNWVSALAPVACVALWCYLRFTRSGFGLRAAGLNVDAAEAAGVRTRCVVLGSMLLAGALASLGGVEFVLGHRGYFEAGFSAGVGYMGIAVALLANNNPLGILLTAFLFGILNYGKVAAAVDVPQDIINIMQAAIILSVIICNQVLGRVLVRVGRKTV